MEVTIDEAIQFCVAEILSYRRAPCINGCEATKEWQYNEAIFTLCKEALLEKKERMKKDE